MGVIGPGGCSNGIRADGGGRAGRRRATARALVAGCVGAPGYRRSTIVSRARRISCKGRAATAWRLLHKDWAQVGDAAGVDLLLPLLDPTALRFSGHRRGHPCLGARSLTHASLPALVELIRLRDLAPVVQLETVDGARCPWRCQRPRDLFLDLLSLSWPPLRAAAVRNLARLDERMFMLVLSGFDVDPHWSVRAELARVLGTLPTDLALPRLRGMLEDPDRRVTPAVLSALVAVRAPEAAALSLELLRT